MASRNIRNTAILAKIEATYGTDPVPTGGTNAMLVSNLSINPINLSLVDREVVRPFFGASEQLPGARFVEMSFDVELVGSGTVAVAPAWDALLQACGFAGTATATFRYDYTPVTSGPGSVTIYWYDDGLLHKATGARGDATFSLKVGEKPKISFKFTGIYNTPTAAANPSVVLTGWKQPQAVVDANTGDLTFGGTHATGVAPAITAGTVYPSQGLEVSLGNSVNFTALTSQETVDLTDRSVSGKVTLDLTAAQEATLMGVVEAATLQSVGLIHGTVLNSKAMLWMPNVQLTNPQKAESNGKRLVSFDLRAIPSAGNDELRVVTSF
jgi:hypothetical protein